jgi:plastocyanin
MLLFWLGRRCLLNLAAGGAILLLAGSWLGWHSHAAAPGRVVIDNFAFAPSALTVTRGTTVTWTNQDDEPHTVTSDGDEKLLKSPALDTDDSFTFTFDKAGTYKYFCTIHPRMQGTVTVE